MGKKITTKLFIKRSIKKHGNIYDYSKVKYLKAKTKVIIICPKHGEFKQTPNNHYIYGCKQCGRYISSKKQSYTTKKFIEKARKKHGNKYNYSNVIYTNSRNKITIICKIHGYNPCIFLPCIVLMDL